MSGKSKARSQRSIGELIDEILPLVSRPGRYTGNEFNIVRKDWQQAALRVALVFPDLYEIGMSHQGLQILYHRLNGRPDLLAERAYCPAPDLEEVLRSRDIPLFSLESRRPLADFDIIGITLPYELCYTNILTVLDLAGLPLRSRDRGDGQPLVIGGGPCAFHPEPVADFFDAILLGDGEEAILEIADLVAEARGQGADRAEILDRLARVEGLYVPSLFTPVHDEKGRFTAMAGPMGGKKVRRRILADIEDEGGDPPLVPLARIVHDRLGIEIARGCTRGCRFCQAGIIYRPVRERSPARIIELAEKGIGESGFDELALLSLSSGDHSCISELVVALMDRLAPQRVSVSLPSMRVGTLSPEIMDQIRRVRKSGFTLAPEAGTDRLRQVINKGISEADLLATSRAAFELGWKLLKFYFMFGLPTETDEDLAAIPILARKALQAGGGGGRRINISVAAFVPKPHTPFQRERQLGIEGSFARIDLLKKELKGKGFQLKWHDPRQSFIEGVMSRGDRRLADLVEAAWRKGARLDAWNDHFDIKTWLEAAADLDIDLGDYLRERGGNEPLPWDHLDCGVDPEFLAEERRKADELVYTPDCRVHGCQKCGLCDFKTIRPLVAGEGSVLPPVRQAGERPVGKVVWRINYERTGPARFLGHLELIQVFYRVLRRSGLPVAYSQGFNPSPKVSFSPALPLGTESRAEYLIVELTEAVADREGVLAAMNALLPAGLVINAIEPDSGRVEQRLLTCYHVSPGTRIEPDQVERFMREEAGEIRVMRKNRPRTVDARSLVKEMAVTDDGNGILLQVLSESSRASLKPMEIVGHVLGLDEEERARARVMKMWCRAA